MTVPNRASAARTMGHFYHLNWPAGSARLAIITPFLSGAVSIFFGEMSPFAMQRWACVTKAFCLYWGMNLCYWLKLAHLKFLSVYHPECIHQRRLHFVFYWSNQRVCTRRSLEILRFEVDFAVACFSTVPDLKWVHAPCRPNDGWDEKAVFPNLDVGLWQHIRLIYDLFPLKLTLLPS